MKTEMTNLIRATTLLVTNLNKLVVYTFNRLKEEDKG